MNIKWVAFVIVVIAVLGFFSLTPEQRQAVAKYLIFCLIAAIVIRPIGLASGNFVRRMIRKD